MKAILLFIFISLASIHVHAQGEGGREPAGGSVNRSPAGESSRERGPNNNSARGEVREKPGKNSVSSEAKTAADNIKAANSADGKGKYMSDTQKTEAARQMGVERARATQSGRSADAKYFAGEQAKLRK